MCKIVFRGYKMASKYLSSLSDIEYQNLTQKLLKIQNNLCFICQEEINLRLSNTNIDHIIPLVNKGSKDNEENFAVTHESCNKSKQDADLNVARILCRLKNIQNNVLENENRTASLNDVLKNFNGSAHSFRYTISNGKMQYSFDKLGDTKIYESEIFEDELSKEKTVFVNIPIEYIYHDSLINPRGINSSIKNNYDYWDHIFAKAKTPDGADVLLKPLNFIEMIKE
jgi:hypothetical protein